MSKADQPHIADLLDHELISHLEEITGGDKEFLMDISAAFLETAGDELCDIEKAISIRDMAEVKQIAHRLWGSSIDIGASRVANQCRQIELLAELGEFDRLKCKQHSLETVLEQVKLTLENVAH